MEEEKYFIGTDLKFKITISADGFDQSVDRYQIDIYSGEQFGGCSHIVVPSEDIVEDDGEYFLLVETRKLSPGMLRLVVTAFVPDEDFPSGYRREVTAQDVAYIKSVV